MAFLYSAITEHSVTTLPVQSCSFLSFHTTPHRLLCFAAWYTQPPGMYWQRSTQCLFYTHKLCQPQGKGFGLPHAPAGCAQRCAACAAAGAGGCGLWHPGSSHLLKMPARAVVGRARHCHTAEETKYILVPIRKAYSDMLPFHTDRQQGNNSGANIPITAAAFLSKALT